MKSEDCLSGPSGYHTKQQTQITPPFFSDEEPERRPEIEVE